MTSPTTPTLTDDRGTLTVHDRAVSTIASAAAAAVDGTSSQASSGLAKLAGRTLPRVDVHNRGGLVRANVAVAAYWPQSIDKVAAAARDRVASDIAEMSGQTVEKVDVTVQALVAGDVAAEEDAAPELPGGLVPRATPAAASVGVLASLLLIAGGVVAIREVLIGAGAIGGARWSPPVVDWIDGLQAQSWMVPAGVGAALLGVILVLLAIKPRRRTHRALLLEGVFLRRNDLGDLLETAVGRVEGAVAGRATSSKRSAKITVTALPDADTKTVHRDVTDAVAREVAILTPVPNIKVKVAAAVQP
ncbi:Asp23/Gls24 family envelope stress response protein [Antrihabitans cavernicola]|uniref:Asp23/Gls24 family envelope stress response protein n=1 Tax=Antrihabitans cavernicola TaxID=2495913 RepID=UPI001659952D|nr:Asp23/Gls24 family envelope stress response protein [Spelaeibacter cavernicola]